MRENLREEPTRLFAVGDSTVMGRLERVDMAHCQRKLNRKGDPAMHVSDKAVPLDELVNEKPKEQAVNYDKLLQA